MLTHISIKNFAIVEHLEIDFTAGLSVLTGETGAGKSLWVDAIQLALGQRADTQWIRADKDRAEISVVFNIQKLPQAKQWLQAADIEEDNTCILRRIMVRQGQSRCMLNGTPIPLQKMREFASLLIQVHSQHQQQQLLQSDHQRQLLDDYANHPTLCNTVETHYKAWKHIESEIEKLKQQAESSQEIEFINYQLTELSELNLQSDEWETLSQQHQQFHYMAELMAHLNQAARLISDEENTSATESLQHAIHEINAIELNDSKLGGIKELLNTAQIHLEEAGTELQNYRETLESSDQPIDVIEARLAKIHDLARKHHCKPTELNTVQTQLQNKLDQLSSVDQRLQVLAQQRNECLVSYQSAASKLTNSRKKYAKQLDKLITQAMREMDIQDAEFHIALSATGDLPTPHGLDKTQFMVQTNAGQGQQPLHKVASGGEISRISLALHVLTADKTQTPTLVFDEVDVGISGKTAAIVGQHLRALGNKAQVFSITHLPQVASFGHQHYKAEKTSNGKQTMTYITHLDETGRIQELARLLGGAKITPQSLAHAAEMLEAHV